MLCKQDLSSTAVEKLKDAVQNNFFFEFFVEDLPMWGYFGEVMNDNLFDEGRVYLYPHLHFKVSIYIYIYITELGMLGFDLQSLDYKSKAHYSY